MKSKIGTLIALLFFISCPILQIYAGETNKKIYVSKEQVIITEEGILAYITKGEKPIMGKTLSFDENGMYIKEWKGPCGLHDVWCRQCGGCGVLFCPMNCSCYD